MYTDATYHLEAYLKFTSPCAELLCSSQQSYLQISRSVCVIKLQVAGISGHVDNTLQNLHFLQLINIGWRVRYICCPRAGLFLAQEKGNQTYCMCYSFFYQTSLQIQDAEWFSTT